MQNNNFLATGQATGNRHPFPLNAPVLFPTPMQFIGMGLFVASPFMVSINLISFVLKVSPGLNNKDLLPDLAAHAYQHQGLHLLSGFLIAFLGIALILFGRR